MLRDDWWVNEWWPSYAFRLPCLDAELGGPNRRLAATVFLAEHCSSFYFFKCKKLFKID
jgi:hypothetical protein